MRPYLRVMDFVWFHFGAFEPPPLTPSPIPTESEVSVLQSLLAGNFGVT